MKTLSPQHLEKLKQGRQKRLEEAAGLVCKINGDYEIWCNEYGFTLRRKGRDEKFFPSIESILAEIQESKEKELMLAAAGKDLASVRQAILDARKWMGEQVKPLFN